MSETPSTPAPAEEPGPLASVDAPPAAAPMPTEAAAPTTGDAAPTAAAAAAATAATAITTAATEGVMPESPGTAAAPSTPSTPAIPATAATPPVPDLPPAVCAAKLAEHFPALFGAGRALPLKLRIQADIQARVPGLFNKKTLSIFLHRYTTSTAYLKALVASPQRCDLDGAPAGEVAEEHRGAAQVEIERRRNIVEARRADERALQREAATAARQAQAARQAAQQAARTAAQDSAEATARRDRAALLRAFEGTTLTRHNFCALKGLIEADLDGQLALAQQEREERPPQPQRPPRPAPPRNHRNDRNHSSTAPARPGRGAHKPQR